MVKARLNDVFVEHRKKELTAPAFGKKNTRWFAVIALSLTEEGGRNNIAEWFYLIACSQKYYDRPFRHGPKLDQRYVIIQDDFDIKQVFQIAEQRVESVHADSWEDFYKNMEKLFLCE